MGGYLDRVRQMEKASGALPGEELFKLGGPEYVKVLAAEAPLGAFTQKILHELEKMELDVRVLQAKTGRNEIAKYYIQFRVAVEELDKGKRAVPRIGAKQGR